MVYLTSSGALPLGEGWSLIMVVSLKKMDYPDICPVSRTTAMMIMVAPERRLTH
jgi:hypothetical protein